MLEYPAGKTDEEQAANKSLALYILERHAEGIVVPLPFGWKLR
jgi:hypothetical protein